MIPEGYITIHNGLPGAIATPTTQGRTRILNKKLKLEETIPGLITLPRLELITPLTTDISEIYEEHIKHIEELLNKLKMSEGQGIYYQWFFQAESAPIKGIQLREEFSAIWSEGRIQNKIITLYTIHE